MKFDEPKMVCRVVAGELFTRRDVWCELCGAMPGEVCVTTHHGAPHIDPRPTHDHELRRRAFKGMAGELLRQRILRQEPAPSWLPHWAVTLIRVYPFGPSDHVVYRVRKTVRAPKFRVAA